MSNQKKNPKRQPPKAKKEQTKPNKAQIETKKPIKKDEGEKKPVKGIIIAAAAIILIVATVLTAIFVVKPAIDKNSDTTKLTADPKYTVPGKEEIFYTEYMGVKMSQEFVDILAQAEEDRKSACSKYGTALEIGDIKISRPEFASYYYDQYSLQRQEIDYSIQQSGANRTGYNIDIMPDAQKHLDDDYMWSEDFTAKAIEAISKNYQGFYKAIDAGIEFSEDDIRFIKSQYDRVELYVETEKRPASELFEAVYGEGYTEAMFKAREIMIYYAQEYESFRKDEIYNSYSEDKLAEEFEKTKVDYRIMTGRVYPIEGEYDAVKISKIKNEKEFLEFANENHPNEEYDAEVTTACDYVTKQQLADVFGPEVALWMFNEDRVPGEINVIKGQLFNYLVYVEKLPYLSTSRKILAYSVDYSTALNEQEIEKMSSDAKAQYDNWLAGDKSIESFRKMCEIITSEPELDARVGNYHYMFDNWIFDESRKTSDHEFIDTDVGCCILYYIGNNEDDFDWKHNLRTDLSEQIYGEELVDDLQKNYEVKRNNTVLNNAYKIINVVITKQRAEEKKNEKNS